MFPHPLSTAPLLVVATAFTLSLGLLHLSKSRGRSDPQLWVALWAFAATVFQSARWVQLSASAPSVAIVAARIYAATSPLLIASLVGYMITLSRRTVARRYLWLGAGANLLVVGAVLATPWFVTGRGHSAHDLFGQPHLGAEFGPALLVLPAYVVGALAWGMRELRPSPEIARREWRVLLVCLVLYGGLGVSSVVAAFTQFPGLAEWGPLVMAVGLSGVQVRRGQRLEQELESLVEAGTAALAASEARYRQLLDNAPIGVFACDLEGRVTTANGRMLAIAGVPPPIAAVEHNVLETPPAVASGVALSIRRCLARGEIVSSEHHVVTPWGAPFDARLVATPLRDARGSQQGAIVLIEDVTERRALDERLRRTQKLEAAGELAAGVAQQIDEPMALARSRLTAFREDWDALFEKAAPAAGEPPSAGRFADCQALIDESLTGIERAIGIARDMREFASTGSAPRAPSDLNSLVAEAVRMVLHQRSDGTRIEERYGPATAPQGAPGPLRQVFVNLLANALQAVGAGGHVLVETCIERGRVVVRVKDDGPGVAPEIRGRLFDPFFTTKPAGEGTGLGLFVSHQIVSAHGGEITLASVPGRGATFEVRLPLG